MTVLLNILMHVCESVQVMRERDRGRKKERCSMCMCRVCVRVSHLSAPWVHVMVCASECMEAYSLFFYSFYTCQGHRRLYGNSQERLPSTHINPSFI